MHIDQNVVMETINEQKESIEQLPANAKEEARQKQLEADESYEKIQFLENDIIEVENEIKTLEEEAEKTRDTQIKEELLRQVEDLQEEKKESEKKIDDTFEKAQMLNTEAKDLREEAELAQKISNEMKEEGLTAPVTLTSETSTVEEKTEDLALEDNADRKSTRLNSSHIPLSRMPSSA